MPCQPPPGQAPSNGWKPCLLDDRLEKRICDYLRLGLSLGDAATLSGTSLKSVTTWRQKGCENEDSRWGQFYEATEKARLQWKAEAIRKITQSSRSSTPQKCKYLVNGYL